MVRLWSGYVLLLASARPLRLVPLTLRMRKTPSPMNENHRRKSGETTNVQGNIMNVGSAEAKHLTMLTILFQEIFRNPNFALVTLSCLVTYTKFRISEPRSLCRWAHLGAGPSHVSLGPNKPAICPEWPFSCRHGGYGLNNNPYPWCIVSRYRICISGLGHIVTFLVSGIWFWWQWRCGRLPSFPFGCCTRYWWSPQHPQHCFGVCWWFGGRG